MGPLHDEHRPGGLYPEDHALRWPYPEAALYPDHYGVHDGRSGQEPCYPEEPADADGCHPLRVIHVGYAMLPAGIDKWVAGLIRHADPRRLRFVRCVVTGGPIDWRQVRRMGVPVEIGGRDSVLRASEDADVLLISDPGAAPDWIDAVRARLGVLVAHGDGDATRSRIERMAPVIHHVIAVSRAVQERVCHDVPSTVIPNGVDPVHLSRSRPRHRVRDRFGFDPGDFVVGFVGRFSPEKNPMAIVEALADLPPRFKALFVGYGPLRDELRRRADEALPGRAAIVRGEEYLGDLYAAMDAFCLPSTSEGFGLVTLEAMMCGRPVVATPVGFVPEAIVDGDNGLVVDGDPASIREAMARLEADPDWGAGLARRAAGYAEEHGYASTMADRYADRLESLWAERTNGDLPA